MDLLLATRNSHKTREFRELLGAAFRVIDLTDLPGVEIPAETGRTFAENATLKAVGASQDRSVSAQLRRDRQSLVIADDSGLEVDALGGAPGVHSARYAGDNARDADNVNKLLGQLSSRKEGEQRFARFRCVIAVARDGKLFGTFEGVVEGRIVDFPRGTNGFGYDPLFQPNGFEQTFAEMAADLKNKISHRARAAAALREALRRI